MRPAGADDAFSEFAEAAGDLPDLAWTLGWSIQA
jgi:hypothetical protein